MLDDSEDSEAVETALQRLDSLDPKALSQLTEILTTALMLLPFFWKAEGPFSLSFFLSFCFCYALRV